MVILLDYLWSFVQLAMLYLTIACLVAPIVWGVYCFEHRKDD